MALSIAVHDHPGTFSDRWIEHARELGVRCERVNCHDSRIVERLRGHDALLWHLHHASPADMLSGRHVIRAAERMGLAVFPSTDTCWSFHDKIAQKYQLEAIGAPIPRTDCFFSEQAALEWIRSATFPVVMKLRGGAGSSNVQLVATRAEAEQLVAQAFGRGLKLGAVVPRDAVLQLARARQRRDLLGVIRRSPQTMLSYWRKKLAQQRERGYVYFQEFLPGNAFDVRVTVVGDRAFSFSRNVRKNDFRASGSGDIDYSPERVRPDCLRIAFETAAKLRTQSAAFDFAFDATNAPRLLEVSFGFMPEFVHACAGYWDPSLRFVEGHVWPQDAILDDLLAQVERRSAARTAAGAAPG